MNMASVGSAALGGQVRRQAVKLAIEDRSSFHGAAASGIGTDSG